MNNTKHESTNVIVRSQHTGLFDALVWVNRAIDLDAPRLFCRYIHVRNTDDNVYLLATDGARLHVTRFKKNQITYPLEEGCYRLHFRNSTTLNLLGRAVPGAELPPNVLALLDFDNTAVEKTAWHREDPEHLHPQDLYRLIVSLGIEEDDKGNQYGFNPDYLVDVISGAYTRVFHKPPHTLHAITPAEGMHPLYHAVLMGIRL